jgi:hypothetical protein
MNVGTTFAILLAAAAVLGYVAAIAYAIVQVVRTQVLSEIEKVVWVVVILFAPLIGSIVWYAA